MMDYGLFILGCVITAISFVLFGAWLLSGRNELHNQIPRAHWPPKTPGKKAIRKAKEFEARIDNPAVKDAWEKYQVILTLAIGPEEKIERTAVNAPTTVTVGALTWNQPQQKQQIQANSIIPAKIKGRR